MVLRWEITRDVLPLAAQTSLFNRMVPCGLFFMALHPSAGSSDDRQLPLVNKRFSYYRRLFLKKSQLRPVKHANSKFFESQGSHLRSLSPVAYRPWEAAATRACIGIWDIWISLRRPMCRQGAAGNSCREVAEIGLVTIRTSTTRSRATRWRIKPSLQRATPRRWAGALVAQDVVGGMRVFSALQPSRGG